MSDDDIPTTVDFRVADVALDWTQKADAIRPWRGELRAAFAELVARERARSVLELGSGPGLLAERVLATCEVDRYTLLDFAQPMLDLARARLGDRSTTHYVLADLRQPDWPAHVAGPVDAALAMQSVHELRHKRHARRLYEQVFDLLRPGGVLAVCDHQPKDDARSRALHATDAEQHAAMTAAGFVEVQTLMIVDTLYLCTARRP